jgi:hypothetical protein
VSEAASRAERALAGVLYRIPRSTVTQSSWVQVVGSWTEGADTICVLYRWPGLECTLGLRRVIEPDVPLDEVVEEIVNYEIGEPLGSLFDPAGIDEEGVFWWDGGPPQHRSYNWGMHRPPSRVRTWFSRFSRRRRGAR